MCSFTPAPAGPLELSNRCLAKPIRQAHAMSRRPGD
jgi:hypothetical protein